MRIKLFREDFVIYLFVCSSCVTFKYFIFVVADTNIMDLVKIKCDTSDTTKIQKKARSKIYRKRNTTLLEDLASEVVSSSQVEVEIFQKEYEEREVVEEEEEKQKEVEEEQGKNIEVVEEEEEKQKQVKQKKEKIEK